jgi:glycerol uptake facilitator-like aquaporin
MLIMVDDKFPELRDELIGSFAWYYVSCTLILLWGLFLGPEWCFWGGAIDAFVGMLFFGVVFPNAAVNPIYLVPRVITKEMSNDRFALRFLASGVGACVAVIVACLPFPSYTLPWLQASGPRTEPLSWIEPFLVEGLFSFGLVGLSLVLATMESQRQMTEWMRRLIFSAVVTVATIIGGPLTGAVFNPIGLLATTNGYVFILTLSGALAYVICPYVAALLCAHLYYNSSSSSSHTHAKDSRKLR